MKRQQNAFSSGIFASLSIRQRFLLASVFVACIAMGLQAWAHQQSFVTFNGGWVCNDEQVPAGESTWEKIAAGGEFYKPLKIVSDVAGVDDPVFFDVGNAGTPKSTAVIGIEVENQAYAFVVDAMRKVDRHIVNAVIEKTPVSVTYCDLVDCVRVLRRDAGSSMPLRVGGLDVDQQLVLLLGETRYGQESPDLPLTDYPFARTSLGQWKQQHPDTKIYVGTPGS